METTMLIDGKRLLMLPSEAIDAAEAAGYALYDKGTPETNYEYVRTTPDNCEIILANKKYRISR